MKMKQMRRNELFRIVTHDPSEIRSEQERLLRRVHHATPFGIVSLVGSTAVDGAIGKGDIDLALGVEIVQFEQTRARLDVAFERDLDQLSNDEFQGYHLPSKFDASLQLFVSGGKFDIFDRFADMLRNDPDLRNAYNALKLIWDGRPMDAYRSEKSRFIENALSKQI